MGAGQPHEVDLPKTFENCPKVAHVFSDFWAVKSSIVTTVLDELPILPITFYFILQERKNVCMYIHKYIQENMYIKGRKKVLGNMGKFRKRLWCNVFRCPKLSKNAGKCGQLPKTFGQ